MLLLTISYCRDTIDFLIEGKDIIEKANKEYNYYISDNSVI